MVKQEDIDSEIPFISMENGENRIIIPHLHVTVGLKFLTVSLLVF